MTMTSMESSCFLISLSSSRPWPRPSGLGLAQSLGPAPLITHTLSLDEAPRGYAIFDRKEDRAIKVMLKP